MKCIQVFKDGKMDEINIKNIKELYDIANNRGLNDIQELFYWNYNEYIIKCYGWYDGQTFINEHKLPIGGDSIFIDSESSKINLYGDIFITKYKKDKLSNIDIEEYSVFYNNQFEIYSDYDSETSSELEYENNQQNENNSQNETISDAIFNINDNDECTIDDYNY